MPSRCRPRRHKIVHLLVSVGSGHADVAILVVRNRPGISKKLTTEEENEEDTLSSVIMFTTSILVIVVEAIVIHY
jgi:pheromone shutdown protein TraB